MTPSYPTRQVPVQLPATISLLIQYDPLDNRFQLASLPADLTGDQVRDLVRQALAAIEQHLASTSGDAPPEPLAQARGDVTLTADIGVIPGSPDDAPQS